HGHRARAQDARGAVSDAPPAARRRARGQGEREARVSARLLSVPRVLPHHARPGDSAVRPRVVFRDGRRQRKLIDSAPGGCMNRTVRKIATAAVVLLAAMTVTDADTPGQSFTTLQNGFTQSLFAATTSFKTKNSYLGGVAVLPSGDVIVAECLTSGTQLHRFSATVTTRVHGTDI